MSYDHDIDQVFDSVSVEDFFSDDSEVQSLTREFSFLRENPEEDPEYKRFAQEQAQKNKRAARRLKHIRTKMAELRNKP